MILRCSRMIFLFVLVRQTMKSVTESLEYFLKPEVLDGDNQYYCQVCAKKVDAVKGLKFDRLPYLLSLQLKRFDFDYTTFQRIKLNDEVRGQGEI